jgi:probable F420-dependent oxidoreductase
VIRVGITGDASVARFESHPVDSLWVGGHVVMRNPTAEAIVALARLCERTVRVQVGTAILLLPLYQPAIVARQLADLDLASGGRLVVGVGVGGEYPEEFRACQVPLSERGRRTDEAIPLLRKLWTGEAVSHDGRYFPFEDVRLNPAPAQPGGPPIVVAGRQPAAMRRAALLGDGWMPYLYSPKRYAASVQTIVETAQEHGRDLDGFGWYVYLFVNVDPDGDRARRDAAAMLGGNWNQDLDAMIRRIAAVGTPEEVGATLREFVDAGARHFVFLPASRTVEGEVIVERLLADVVPELRADGAVDVAP